jgi:hypothetical protein
LEKEIVDFGWGSDDGFALLRKDVPVIPSIIIALISE